MVVARRRRRRRPVIPVLLLLVTVVAGAVTLARHTPNRKDLTMAWLDQVRPIVEQSNEGGTELTDIRTNLAKLDRTTVRRRLDRLERDAKDTLIQVERLSAPANLSTAQGLLVAGLAMRVRGIGELRPALDAALGADAVNEVAVKLAQAGNDLIVGDRDYEVFASTVPTYHQPVTVASRWVNDPTEWDAAVLSTLVAALRASASLAPVHDVSLVTVATDPPATGKENDADVLPAAKSLRLQAVVADIGNESESHVTIIATLTLADGTVTTARQFVDLDAGQRRTVQLGGLKMAADQLMTLSVRVEPVPGETSVADNETTRKLVVHG